MPGIIGGKEVLKKDYNKLCSKVKILMETKWNGVPGQRENEYVVETKAESLRVKIADFERGNRPTWIFTCVDRPKDVIKGIRNRNNFNEFSGKHNEFSNDVMWLVSWLGCYIKDLKNPTPSGFATIPDGIAETC